MRKGIVLLLLAFGCGWSRPPAPRQSEAMERSTRILRQLNRLEADLQNADAETTTYGVLVDRHGQAQEMACKVTEDHVAEIHRLAVAQEEKVRQKRNDRLRKRKAVAQLSPHAGHKISMQ
jgi:hypothetical protein